MQVVAGDMVVRPDLGAAKAREERLGLVRTSVTVRVALFMIDPLRKKAIVKDVPTARFVGMNDGIGSDAGRNGLHGLPLGPYDGGDGDPAALAHDDHDAALAGLVLRLAAIDPVHFPIGRLNVPAKIRTVHLHGAL